MSVAQMIAVRLAEFWCLLKARLALVAGRRSQARRSLKAALRHNPHGFAAHFLLGRLYWADGSPVKARREFDLAWQIDPERFERGFARLRAQDPRIPEFFPLPGEELQIPVSVQRDRRRRSGDFRSEAERRRLSRLPPITLDEIQRIDWERLEEQLRRESESL